ncbi:MAG: helix-turn-helix transcriptional regulator [Lachnospiraceae bacterium]
MGNATRKKNRVLDIFYRAMKGENLSVGKIADEYGVSTKSISRDISEIKNFLSDNRDIVGNTELKYSSASKSYYMEFENFLLSKELMAIMKMMIGCRAFSKMDVLELSSKLKNFISYHDKEIMDHLLAKEMYHYKEVNHDCKSLIDNIWQLTRCIHEKIEISVTYYKMDRKLVERRIKPVAITFSEYYFYLIAYHSDKDDWKPLYYRVDRIINVVEHRNHFVLDKKHDFDEGELRSKIQFMFPGDYRKIKFEYTGPSAQAILDKIPTAKIVDIKGSTKIIEAETYGTGINMFLLSQGKMVKVLEPQSLVDELVSEIKNMSGLYSPK